MRPCYKRIPKILKDLKGWSQLEDTFTLRSALREDQTLQLERLASALAKDVQTSSRQMAKGIRTNRIVRSFPSVFFSIPYSGPLCTRKLKFCLRLPYRFSIYLRGKICYTGM